MRSLTATECNAIAGGNNELMIGVGIIALVGGVVSTTVASWLSPFSTAIGTVGGAVICGAICTPVFPVVGTITCGAMGALAGYVTSSTLFNVTSFFAGAAGAGLAAYSYIPH